MASLATNVSKKISGISSEEFPGFLPVEYRRMFIIHISEKNARRKMKFFKNIFVLPDRGMGAASGAAF
ncbi:MAG: hypothetical protein K6C96_09990 [Butyrivibrio sp.]|nr:hypothetical protein [Butyrivibrio sp.]